ncbi:MAG: hypothetical protein HC906_12430, partial [Bacteroidales bacterium]|nr:hypothetical protein [Bacteroidales bacterium]
FARTWQPWRVKLPEFFPEIENLVELRRLKPATVKTTETSFYEENVFATDSNAFKVFDFEFIQGSGKNAIVQKNTCVVSEKFARKCFPNQNALNRQVQIYGNTMDDFETFTITGIFKSMPDNSHFHADILFHYEKPEDESGNDFAYTYFLLKKGSSIENIIARNDEFMQVHVPENQRKGSIIHYMPLTDIHLKSNIEREMEQNADLKQIKLIGLAAVGIFVIALVNYINLSLASFGKRRKDFNINQVLGAKKSHHALQLLNESFLTVTTAFFASLVLFKPVQSLLQSLNIMNISPISGFGSFFILGTIILLYFLTVFSGILPVYLIKMPLNRLSKPASAAPGKRTAFTNNSLLILQYTVSIVVIAGSIVIHKQNNFLFSKNLGVGNDHIVMADRNFWVEEPEVMQFKEELLKHAVIEDVTMVMDPPAYLVKDARRVEYGDIPEENKNLIIPILPADDSFFSFFNIPFVAGGERKYVTGQKHENYILNESAIKKLGFKSAESAIGTPFKVNSFQNEISGGTIVGVVKDFHFASLYHPIEPTIYFQKPIWHWTYLIKIVPGNENETLATINRTWKEIFPDHPFDYTFCRMFMLPNTGKTFAPINC